MQLDKFNELIKSIEFKYSLTEAKICEQCGYNPGYISQCRSRNSFPKKFIKLLIEKYFPSGVIYPENERPLPVIQEGLLDRLLNEKTKEELIQLLKEAQFKPANPTLDFVEDVKKKKKSA